MKTETEFDKQVKRLRDGGFTTIYKTRATYNPKKGLDFLDRFTQSITGERLRLNDNTYTLKKSEHWFPVYWDGEEYKTVFFNPAGVTGKAQIIFSTDKTPRPNSMSKDSQDYIEHQVYLHRCKSKNVTAHFQSKDKNNHTLRTHLDHLETLPEWNNRDMKADYVIEPISGASESGQCHRLMEYAMQCISKLAGENLTDEHWKAFEAIFRAGQLAHQSESWESRHISIKGEPLVVKQLTQHTPRREWTQAATEILRKDIKTSAQKIAMALKADNIVDFDEWGDDIDFFDNNEEIKSKQAFETAISRLKRSLKK